MKNRSLLRWRFPSSQATEGDIAAVEAQFGVTLPADLRECVLKHNGARPEPNVFDLPDGNSSVFESLLSFCSQDENSVVRWVEDQRTSLPHNTVPFALDPFGNLICLQYGSRNALVRVVFWDHEVAGTSPDEAIVELSDSFDEFLALLYESTD